MMKPRRFTSVLQGDEYYLADHTVADIKTLPGVVYLELARAAGAHHFGDRLTGFKDIVWMTPVQVTDADVHLQVLLEPRDGEIPYRVITRDSSGTEKTHAKGILTCGASPLVEDRSTLNLDAIQTRCRDIVEPFEFYEIIRGGRVNHGPSLQVVNQFHYNQNECLAALSLPEEDADVDLEDTLDPALMDGVLQVASVHCVRTFFGGQTKTHLPFAIEECHIHAPLTPRCWVHAAQRRVDTGEAGTLVKFDLHIYDDQGTRSLDLIGFTLRPLSEPTSTVEIRKPGPVAAAKTKQPLPSSKPSTDDREALMAFLIKTLAEVLLCEQSSISSEANMLELGIDSVIGVEVVEHINRRRHLELKATVLYEQPTLEKLCDFIMGQNPGNSESLDAGAVAASPVAAQTEIVADETGIKAEMASSEQVSRLRHMLAEVLLSEPDELDDQRTLVDMGLDSVTGVEYVERINRAFGSDLKATIIYEQNTLPRLAAYLHQKAEPVAEITPPIERSPSFKAKPAVELKTPPEKSIARGLGAAQHKDLLEQLRGLMAETLLLSSAELPADKNFLELGLDSILGVQFVDAVKDQLDLSIPATTIYEQPTLERLAQFLASRFADQLMAKPSKKSPSATTRISLPTPSGLDVNPPLPSNAKPTITAAAPPKPSRDIAIIGVSCRFAGSENLDQLWDNLVTGADLLEAFPKDHFDIEPYKSDPGKPGGIYCNKGYFLKDIDQFDPRFFKMTPREAESMDPQLRILLQSAWHTFEDAGYAAQMAGTNTGVYVGNVFTHYYLLLRQLRESDYQYVISGNGNCNLANRLSYTFDLRGPSFALDTGCSASMVALDLAVESLRSGRTDMALVGASALNLEPYKYQSLCAVGALSKTSSNHPFDAAADGFVTGEGVATILLKRRDEAERDGDHIYGLIKGSYVKHGGFSGGPTVPNVDLETEVMLAAWNDAGINAESLSYYEAHGTGTKLGDPLEINAFTRAVQSHTDKQNFCRVGTVKANLGHTEEVAGLAGIIKVLLMMKHRTKLGLPFLRQLNPMIRDTAVPYQISRENEAWNSDQGVPRRAGVSAFGLSGTLAHIVIEEPPEMAVPAANDHPLAQLFVFSAQNKTRLQAYLTNWCTFLDSDQARGRDKSFTLASVAFSLQTGRQAMGERLAVVAGNLEILRAKLKAFLEGESDISELFHGSVRSQKKGVENPYISLDDSAVNALVRQENNSAVGELWVRGQTIDWDALWADAKPRKVPLPTYVFDQKRYWFQEQAEPESLPTPTAKMADASSKGPISQQTLMFQPVLVEKSGQGNAFELGRRVVFVYGRNESFCRDLEKKLTGSGDEVRVLILPELTELNLKTAGDIENMAVNVFDTLKQMIAEKPERAMLPQILQVVIDHSGDRRKLPLSLIGALVGMLRTASLENGKILGQLIELEGQELQRDTGWWSARLQENGYQELDKHIVYSSNEQGSLARLVWQWREHNGSRQKLPVAPVWQDEGVYLITGGMGGLGLLFAEAIVASCTQPKLVLTGRSSFESVYRDQRRKTWDDLLARGAEMVYRQVDVVNGEAVSKMVADILARFGKIDGVIHSAGVNRDNFILKKTEEEIRTVLSPKIRGTLNLDLATRDLPMSFFVLFSSVAGSMGNPGQADYATGNAFLDRFSRYRNEQCAAGYRQGLTLSINWPTWEQGGMQVEASHQEVLTRTIGLSQLGTREGLDAFYQAVTAGDTQMMVLPGEPQRIRQWIERNQESVTIPSGMDGLATELSQRAVLKQDQTLTNSGLLEKTLDSLRTLFGKATKLDPAEIMVDEALEQYGIDSILITQLNEMLVKVFVPNCPEKLSKTLFYEYLTLDSLAEYFVHDFPQECAAWTDWSPPLASGESRGSESDLAGQASDESAASETLGHSGNGDREPIAIIGLAGRYPKSPSIDDFWQNLAQGADCVSEIPAERWPIEGFFHPDQDEALARGQSYSKWGAFLEGFADFDPLFFNISPREAINMDPQERLFLEASWQALEDAGYTRKAVKDRYQGKVGVYAGITKTGFMLHGLEARNPQNPSNPEQNYPYTCFSSVANRISYLFDFSGPSMPVDTMCSSSLTAIHEACEAMYRGECSMAIAGGVNLYLHPYSYLGLCSHKMLSPNGRCRSFGAGADGFVPGEGVGTVLLKPLSQAEADGDHIYALIRATSINHCGKTNGYTVPSPNAQANLIRQALDKAGVDARQVSYIEAHGTGTELGDPIEITGLTQAFRRDTEAKEYCAIGSAKSNLGHLEAAAGIAGLTKVVLQMNHRVLAPSLHAEPANPNIHFPDTPFVVQTQASEWSLDEAAGVRSRLAGVSSFGAGGANAHVLLEEYATPIQKCDEGSQSHAILFSASQPAHLQEYARELMKVITDQQGRARQRYEPSDEQGFLSDVAYTLQTGREPRELRIGFTVESIEELIGKLEQVAAGETNHGSGIFFGNSDEPAKAPRKTVGEIGSWLDQKQYDLLLEAWSSGSKVDWSMLYPTSDRAVRRRVSLPPTPMDHETFWLAELGLEPHARGAALVGAGAKTEALGSKQPTSAGTQQQVKQEKPRGIGLLPVETLSSLATPPTMDKPQTSLASVDNLAPVAVSSSVQPEDSSYEVVLETMRKTLAITLYLDFKDIDSQANFSELGLDSILADEWSRILHQEFGIKIRPRDMFQHANLHLLTTLIINQDQNPTTSDAVLAGTAMDHLSLEEVLFAVQHGMLELEEAEQYLGQTTS